MMMSNWIKIMSLLCRKKTNLKSSDILTCFMSAQWWSWAAMKLPSLPLPPMREKFLNEHANCVLIGMKTAHTHKQSFVLSLCIRRRWRGPILHSRVDRSLVYFIHFTWRDACLSWLAASLRFTRHCTRQTMRQFCSRPASSGESALDRCYCIRFQLKYH